MDLGIENLRVLVTAGAGGIGLEIARAFVRERAKVHVCDVDGAALNAIAESDPQLSHSLCDVSDRVQVARLFDEGLAALGGLDCLVNNAGIQGPTGRVDEVAPEDWDRCVSVCLTGHYNCTRLAVPHLLSSANPSIVNLSSAAGKFGFALRSPYAAAKWGVIGFTKSISIELGPMGIRANAILPGVVAGDRIRRVFEAKARAANVSPEDIQARALAYASIKELIEPQQLADLVTFIASPRGRTISGQALSVDGDLQGLA
jgi:NAD(P)-dependent dehydrogenase (short-subunit alcohol dehydrogenase family)